MAGKSRETIAITMPNCISYLACPLSKCTTTCPLVLRKLDLGLPWGYGMRPRFFLRVPCPSTICQWYNQWLAMTTAGAERRAMHIELTEQERLKAQQGQPVDVIDP